MARQKLILDFVDGTAKVTPVLLRAAAAGDAEARYACYLHGDWSSRAGRAAAIRRLRCAARQGHVEAMFEYGRTWCYLNAHPTSAAHWVSCAAEAGHTQAQYTLGKWYEQGWGVQQSFEQAVCWYWRAAISGEEFARQRLDELAMQRVGIWAWTR